MKRILVVDDDEFANVTVKAELKKHDSEINIVEKGFGDFEDSLDEFLPHIVILDLINGSPQVGELVGVSFYEKIFKDRSCPTIIHSARADDFKEEFDEHPLVKIVTKGDGAEKKVAAAVDEFGCLISSLRNVERRLHHELCRFLKQGHEHVVRHSAGKPEVLEYLALRSIAASLDEVGADGRKLNPWECFLTPAVGESPLLGDLLIKRQSGSADKTERRAEELVAENYAIVLTPSCDLVSSGERDPKVAEFLVCKCRQITNEDLDSAARPAKVARRLSQGFHQHLFPIPGFPGKWPVMAGDFRQLLMVPVDTSEGEYERIASFDSPFRELVSWAFVQYCGKPGLPDRDYVEWAGDILQPRSK